MFEDLYDGIGGKIKSLAKVIFVVESVLFMIAAFILMSKEELTIWGILLLIGGPISAWISSWLLYALGELVEKTSANAKNTKAIVALLEEQRRERDMAREAQREGTVTQKNVVFKEEALDRSSTQEAVVSTSAKHSWRCEKCGKMISTTPCVHCGYVKPRQKLNEKPVENKENSDTANFSTTEKGTIICLQCNYEQPNYRKVCWNCGTKFVQLTNPVIDKNDSTAPYWCGKCGHEGPYDGNCPKCSSSLKKYNV